MVRKHKNFRSEAELAATVVTWLNVEQWDVYQEVSLGYGCRVIDIVAVRDPIVMIVECKLSLSFSVLDQAMGMIGSANYIAVATPRVRTENHGRAYAYHCMNRDGIGHIVSDGRFVSWSMRPKLFRRVHAPIRNAIKPEHKLFAKAGSADGGHYTEFGMTCRKLAKIVNERPGISLGDAIVALDHHYASDATAKASLSKWIRCGKVRGIEARRVGRKLCLFAINEPPNER